MKKVIRLTELDLNKIVRRVIKEDMYIGKKGLGGSDKYEDLRGEIEPGDVVQFKKYGIVYVLTILGDGYLVSDDEEQRFMGDSADGYIIPLSAAKKAIMVDRSEDYDEEYYG